MRQNLPNLAVFALLAALALGGLYVSEKYIWPPAPKPPTPPALPKVPAELAAAVGGAPVLGADPFAKLAPLPAPKPPEVVKPAEPPKPAAPAKPVAHIALGTGEFHLRAVLTSRGAGVQQLVLNKFDGADRLGREEIDPATGQRRPLHLIPGFVRPHYFEVARQPEFKEVSVNYSADDLKAGRTPGPVANPEWLTRPAYLLYHYPSKDDPARPTEEPKEGDPPVESFPLADLGERVWTVASIVQSDGTAPAEVAFETDLPAPYFLKLRKTFTLAPHEYDIKLRVDIEPLPGRTKEAGAFRYQLAGPVGMPIEGEWYTSTYRNVYVGWRDGYGVPRRAIDDPVSVHHKHGGDVTRKPGRFLYAAVGTQYFASALAVVGEYDESTQPWEYVRPTREESQIDFDRVRRLVPPDDVPAVETKYDPDRAFLYDVSFRAVSREFSPAAGEKLSHQYAVYNGPMKVRLLRQLAGDRAVPADVVNKYHDEWGLNTLADYHSPNWFGRQSNWLGWTWVLITTTNMMHEILGLYGSWVGVWGFAIMMLTVTVRMVLFLPSRRQQTINAHMSARLATIKPELDKLNEKYNGDFLNPQMQAERAKLMKKAGISQRAQMGGCLLVFAQMPIFMGLYFCLQESVFFRLQEFGWIPNLAAPDMLVWWSEWIPLLSVPSNRFGGFSFLYLGPYFNLLPLGAVVLFWVQQKLTMPPPTNEMEEQQRQMMKFMLIFTGLFFYKVAAGLCVYFIVSGLWTLMERKLVPKPDLSKALAVGGGGGGDDGPGGGKKPDDGPPKPQGWLGRKMGEMRERMEELQRQAEAQRQFRNDAPGGGKGPPPPRPPGGGNRPDRKKKKRK